MKSSQSNFNLRSPSSYLARSYLIATVIMEDFLNEWVVKGVASDLNDFIVDPRVIFFLNICM